MVKADVIIVGAGIGGLTLSYLLKKEGVNCLLLESTGRTGGWINSLEQSGFLLETGPNSTFRSDELIALANELGLSESLITPSSSSKRKYLVKDSKRRASQLTAVPLSLIEAATTNILSTFGKLRVFAEPFFPRTTTEDTSVLDFVSRRLGSEVANNIVAPALSGIWAADISKLSARAALPHLWEAEQSYGSLLLGGPRVKKRRGRRQMVSFRRGLSELSDALARSIGDTSIVLDCEVLSLTLNESGAKLETTKGPFSCLHAVITTPAKVSSKLLHSELPELADKIKEIPYAPIGVLHVAANIEEVGHPLDGFGFLAPPKKGRALLGTVFTSTLFPERAPEGKCLLTCFLGGASNPELADATSANIQNNALAELRSLLNVSGTLDVIGSYFHKRAIPNFPLGHVGTQSKIDALHQEKDQLSILANWDRGTSVIDRIENAHRRAEIITEILTQAVGSRHGDERAIGQ